MRAPATRGARRQQTGPLSRSEQTRNLPHLRGHHGAHLPRVAGGLSRRPRPLAQAPPLRRLDLQPSCERLPLGWNSPRADTVVLLRRYAAQAAHHRGVLHVCGHRWPHGRRGIVPRAGLGPHRADRSRRPAASGQRRGVDPVNGRCCPAELTESAPWDGPVTWPSGPGQRLAVVANLTMQLVLGSEAQGVKLPIDFPTIPYPWNRAVIFLANVPIMVLAGAISYWFVVPLPKVEMRRRAAPRRVVRRPRPVLPQTACWCWAWSRTSWPTPDNRSTRT